MIRTSHTAVIVAAQKAAQEAELKAKLILEASQIRKEKEKLRLQEEALAKTTQKPSSQAPSPEPQPGPSKIPTLRPQTLLERINQEIKAQTIPKPVPIATRSTASTPRKLYPRIVPAEKIEKRLVKKFARHGLDTSSQENELLKSSVSA